MANDIVFYARADNANFLARRSYNSPTPGILGGSLKPTLDVDATALSGNNINMDGGSTSNRGLCYPFQGCLTTQGFTLGLRAKFGVSSGNLGFFEIAPAASFPSGKITLYLASQNWNAIIATETNTFATNAGTLYGVGPTTAVWHDLCWTWDGSTTASKIKFWLDGVNLGSLTATNAMTNPRDGNKLMYICLGAVDNLLTTRYKVDEFFCLNYELDPSVGLLLEDGTTSALNGTLRTSLIKANPFCGQPLFSSGRLANQ